ncbi:MAG TPA: efflux RND transporter periplasmic adaptor subunit [Tepidisphaeraceae bacterium]|jgi:RND family efflux transporter MFP subunit|nr:efflux RND transporter periplasmic adaptor subunit [Tepidisphaeraceae bacterium]
MNTTTPQPPTHAAPPPTDHDGNGKAPGHHDPHAHADKAAVHDLPTDLPKPSGFVVALVGVSAALLLAAMFLIGFIPHREQEAQIDKDAEAIANAVPIVDLAPVTKAKPASDVYLPANVQAWQQTALYPRVTGYIASWTHDIGSHVNKDDVLAVISAPDVDAQLRQNIANLAQGRAAVDKANADVTIAQNTYQRYQQWMSTTAGVSQQDLEDRKNAYEDAVAIEHQAEANVKALQAAVDELQVQQKFETILAPFTGTVTARNYDVGALMSANNATAKEMFDMAETDKLRVFIDVPQAYADAVKIGQAKAYLTVRNYPGREFEGTVARSTGAVDPASRTMPIEVDIPNRDGLLNPGMYGTIRLPVGNPHPALIIPTSALVFDAKGLRVATVKDNTVHFAEIDAGRDYGTSIEVLKGISSSDQIIDNPGEEIAEGAKVQIAEPNQPGPAPSNQRVAQTN